MCKHTDLYSVHTLIHPSNTKSCLNKPSCRSEESGLTVQFSSRKIKRSGLHPCYLYLRKCSTSFTSNELFLLSPKYSLVIKPAEVPIQTSFVTHFNWGFNVRSEKLLSSTAFHRPIMCSTNSKLSVCHRIHFLLSNSWEFNRNWNGSFLNVIC